MDFFLMAWEKDPWHFGFFDWMIATGGCMLSISRSGTRYPLCGAVSQSLFGDSKNETLWVYSCVCGQWLFMSYCSVCVIVMVWYVWREEERFTVYSFNIYCENELMFLLLLSFSRCCFLSTVNREMSRISIKPTILRQ